MKLRYMIEYALQDRDTAPHYEPIGVWVQGPGPGLDIEMAYLPGNEDYAEEADWVINRLVENDIKLLPDGFLEYYRSIMSPYRGMRGDILETVTYRSLGECVCQVNSLLHRSQESATS